MHLNRYIISGFFTMSNPLTFADYVCRSPLISQKPQYWDKKSRDKHIYAIRSYLAKNGKIRLLLCVAKYIRM